MLPPLAHKALFKNLGLTYQARLLGDTSKALTVVLRASRDNDSEFLERRQARDRLVLYVNTAELETLDQDARIEVLTKERGGTDRDCSKTYGLVEAPEYHPSGCYIRCNVRELTA